MVRMNVLAAALKSINNSEKHGKRQHGYIDEFEIIDDHRAGKIVVNLIRNWHITRMDNPIKTYISRQITLLGFQPVVP
uniref:40S ribosomal protein S15a n=1 Tax=Chrysemys picta bellii TaxID=8478 RepID=A0A8C3PBB8_CHRPI